jgi:hypothetical protein
MAEILRLNRPFHFRHTLEKLDGRTFVADVDRGDGKGFIAATRGGAAIHADLSKSLSVLEAGTNDYGNGVIRAPALKSHLNNATYLGKSVFVCIRFGSDSDPDFEEYYEYTVALA